MTQPIAHDSLSAARLAELSANYNHVGMQRERILACLRQAGPVGMLRPELEAVCNAPSVTSRIAELRKKGAPIETTWESVTGSDGLVSACARYVLHEGPRAQAGLFPEDTQP